ncbi:MAG: DUF805 domain-containing protein [Mesorhizobium sp.]
MKGEVLYFDDERGIGFANGDDGNRYHFDRGDLPAGYAPRKGMRIAFTPSGNRAGAIQPEGGFVAAPAAASPSTREARPTGAVPSITAGAVTSAPMSAQPADAPDPRSLFGHFRYCVTGGYARFGGRARRREYWGFVLFFLLMMSLVSFAALVIDAGAGNLDRDEPITLAILAPLVLLAMILPSIAVTVRRIHDIGLSGWFVLLGLIPTIGSLILIVFALIPSQGKANRWGDVPPGAL